MATMDTYVCCYYIQYEFQTTGNLVVFNWTLIGLNNPFTRSAVFIYLGFDLAFNTLHRSYHDE